jgi:protein-export membrane protein SecD
VLLVLAGLLHYPQPYDNVVSWVNEKTGWSLPEYSKAPFKLGLDLQGGASLMYEAHTEDIEGVSAEDAVAGVRDVIERRVNAIGVAEPLVQTTKVGDSHRVIVELAGITDVNEAINLIGETPLLEFREENNEPPRELTAEEQDLLGEFNKDLKAAADQALRELRANPTAWGDKVQELSDDPIQIKSQGGSIGAVAQTNDLYDIAANVDAGQVGRTYFEDDAAIQIIRVDSKENVEEISASHILICFEGASRCAAESPLSKEDALAKAQELKAQATPANFADLAKANSTEPNADRSGGDLGSFRKGVMVQEFEEAVLAMQVGAISEPVETEFGYHLIYKKGVETVTDIEVSRIYLKKQTALDYVDQEPFVNTELNGAHLKRAQVQFQGQTNEPVVSLEFNEEGQQLFADITGRNLNRTVAIYLDGQIISAPRVQAVITTGEAIISGGFDIAGARVLAQRLNAGALPVPIELLSQQTVGATLGHESVSQSLFAGMIALLLVALYMIVYYRIPGLISVLALAFYGVLLLALFKIIGVTLTLAGLAGVTLSIGMAVDANVLIFERLKEELKSGKPYQSAVDEAFKRAWTSIRDGNVSTIITTVILGWFATSFIKGFALTLGIGVILSMFTAIVVTRVLMKIIARKSLVHKMPALFLQATKGDIK